MGPIKKPWKNHQVINTIWKGAAAAAITSAKEYRPIPPLSRSKVSNSRVIQCLLLRNPIFAVTVMMLPWEMRVPMIQVVWHNIKGSHINNISNTLWQQFPSLPPIIPLNQVVEVVEAEVKCKPLDKNHRPMHSRHRFKCLLIVLVLPPPLKIPLKSFRPCQGPMRPLEEVVVVVASNSTPLDQPNPMSRLPNLPIQP